MKKFLLSSALIACATLSIGAQTLTENWSNWDASSFSISSDSPTATVKSSQTDITYTFTGAYIMSNSNPYYLFFNAKNYKSPAANVEFTLPFDCSKIEVTTSGGCSTNAQSKISFLIDGEVKETIAVNKQNETYTFNVPASEGASGAKFCFQSATSDYNQQFVTFTYYEATDEPSVSINKSYNFAAPLNGEQSVTVVPAVNNYTGNVTITIDNDQFTAPTSMSTDEIAEGFELKFNATTGGDVAGTITITAGTATTTATLTAFGAFHEGTESDPLSVTDVLGMNNLNIGPFYVSGIINANTANNGSNGIIGESGTPQDTNIILKDSEGNMIPVALPAGETRTTLNIVDNPDNVGKTVVISGTLEAYYGVAGVKNTSYISGLTGTGVEALNALDKTAVYYNLQGVKVSNPVKGQIYIVNGKKVVF